MDEFQKYWDFPLFTLSSGPVVTAGQVVLTLLVIFIGFFISWYLQRLLGRQMLKANVNPNVTQTVQRIVFYSVLVLLFITVLGMLRIPITALAFISGAVAIGVGFGAQNIINNLISGWILMSERPVRIGDFVEIDSHKGTVEVIGNRSTRIRRIDGVHLLVPNSQMLERVVVNWTLVDKNFRSTVRVGVNYGSPIRLVEKLLLEAADEHKLTLKDPPIIVVFEDYGDNALIFDVFFWCIGTGEKELRQIRSDIRFRIEELFAENGIVIAFPQRDVHLYAKTPIEVTTKQP
ncbi:MAG: mechanosensitive ion channel [Xanthomonadales bacterium]|nr:mechanosensitive ion channel [Gammaproteobacteria bacterium]MBT8053456.1 mechanosensitive ion channel [Gammaproteobacteria bacterium]NND58209.1 mechanosensitive ion channel [Xanthomonadales bacterium]NNK50020.1 mechanosensitive ion channel [Xanthomonadales bacterium]